jgi:4-diphosphocytidyl-2C-methyl-D-erythritol kinase
VAPEVDEWRAELVHRWGVPVVMTGSGAALFAYFSTLAEAEDAAAAAPKEAVAARAAEPEPGGHVILE